ncbi:MAG TPA: hypothetical protein VI298_02015 [Geobacteraceae bacterium]
MNNKSGFHRTVQLSLLLSLLLMPALSRAAVMNDYCVVPAFVGENVPSNLLLLIDNSSSMYDLTYSDQGNTDSTGTVTRQPYYCYDETYQSANVYAGYFSSTVNYKFDFTNNYFTSIPSVPTDCTSTIANTLCVGIVQDPVTKAISVNYFAALGNYLNWLAASKFDVEKQILTGGKVVAKLCSGTDRSCNSDADCASGQSCTAVAGNSFLQAESRGCLGQSFIKTPLTSDFVNFTTTDPNTKLGLTFAIHGPVNPNNPSAPSRGGQTYIDIYNGSYNNQLCQVAVNDYYDTSASQTTVRDAVQACINFNPKNYCSKDPSRTYVYTCSRDSDCLYTTNVPTAGKCTAPIDPNTGLGIACFNDNDCSEYVPGGCSNAPAGVTMPCNTSSASTDCYIAAKQGNCNAGPKGGLGCWSDSDCGSTINPGTCSNNGNSCTSDSGCTVFSVIGGCSNNPPATGQCSTAQDCTVTTTWGYCSGYDSAQLCSANSTCSGTSSCTNKDTSGNWINCTTTGNAGCAAGAISAGKCNNAAATTCTSNANCSGAAVNSGTCSNHAVKCTTSTDCTYVVPNSGKCTGTGSSVSCTTNTDCSGYVIPLSGYCSVKKAGSYVSCTTNAECGVPGDPTKYGTCTNPSPTASTCNNPAPTTSTGSCNNTTASTCSAPYPNPSTGGSCAANTCVGAVLSTGTCTNPTPVSGSSGICNNVTTTQYYCNSPSPVTTSTGTCTKPNPTTTVVGTCIGSSPTTTTDYGPCIVLDKSGAVKTKIALTETVQTCWTYLAKGQRIGTGDYNRLIGGNKCDDVYAAWGLCHNDYTAGCTIDADCSGTTGPCDHGPATILPGNAATICGLQYLGQYCTPSVWNGTSTTCTWNTSDPAAIENTYASFCNAQQPTVIDPSDSAASNANYEQMPALLGGVGAEAQIGMPIGTIPVRLNIDPNAQPNGPSGLLQQYASRLRIGAMSFDFNGSKTEAVSGAVIALPRVCSNDNTLLCNQDADCGSGNTCLDTGSSASYNQDGGQIKYGSYVGEGKCATMTQQVCATDANCAFGNNCINGFCGTWHSSPARCATDYVCASGDTCMANGAGDHTAGIINAIDSIRANAWTPFAEAYYNAIGYFARTSSGTSRTDLRLNSADFDETLNPSQYKCQQNYVLLITDGSSTADQNASVQSLAGTYQSAAIPGGGTAPTDWDSTCSYFAGSTYLPIMSWLAKNRNIADFSTTPQYGRDNITTYVVSTGNNSNGLAATDECNPLKLLTDTAANGGTTLKQANNPQQLYSSLQTVFQELAARSASGTAASILSNSEGSGANILQAIFFPRKIFDNDTQAFWLGEMNSLWYYVDPFIGNSSMREDTNGDNALELMQDNVVQFYFDQVAGQTKVNLWQDTNGDGSGDTPVASGISPDLLKSLWKAGKQLWSRDISSTVSPRSIYTPTGTGLMNFTWDTATATALQTYLQAADVPTAQNLIRYVHGFDYPGNTAWRSRTVQIGSIPSANLTDAAYTTNPRDKGIGVWKLGDIISSTPRTQSSVRQNAYNLSAPTGYTDTSYGNDNRKTGYIYTTSGYSTSDGRSLPPYNSRGMVYVGANDGMLHAFKLGTLKVMDEGDKKAELTDTTGIGNEIWAFMPTNVLPYLKYYADPNYSHLYFMDGSTKVVDASVGGCNGGNYWDCAKDSAGSTWRTLLIGGMGIGGASRNSDDSCQDGVSGTCVKTPIPGVGYSSYYALDVTDQNSPRFLWEFSDAAISDPADKGLGFATSGTALVRISARDAGGNPDKTKNGRWFAVFASGATGPIDKSANHRFMATSNQPLKVYVVDLNATTPFQKGTNYWVISDVYDGGTTSGATVAGATKGTLANAFAGSLVNGNVDTDKWSPAAAGNYQDDAIYFGYTQKTGANGPWTSGGVLKLVTFEDPNPDNWRLVKVFDGVGPVTSAVARLQDPKNHHLWLFFGTGRYYYMKDDFDTARQIFGIKDACYRINDTLDPNCAVKHTSGDEVDETTPNSSTNDVGWSITLRGKSTTDPNNIFGAERNISDPTALTNGAVFFTTYKPNYDLCQYGGRTYMWGVKWDTGTQASPKSLKGKALIQVSTGEFKQIDLSTALDDMGGRAMGDPGMTGKGSNDSSVFITNSNNKPVKRIMHMQEH